MMARSSWAPEKRSVKKRVPKVSVILKNYIVNVSNPKSLLLHVVATISIFPIIVFIGHLVQDQVSRNWSQHSV